MLLLAYLEQQLVSLVILSMVARVVLSRMAREVCGRYGGRRGVVRSDLLAVPRREGNRIT